VGAWAETILADTRACTACLACELACAFRWSKKVGAAQSYVLVRRDEASGLADIRVLDGCDVCRGVEVPFCIAVCTPRALRLGRRRRTTAEEAVS